MQIYLDYDSICKVTKKVEERGWELPVVFITEGAGVWVLNFDASAQIVSCHLLLTTLELKQPILF